MKYFTDLLHVFHADHLIALDKEGNPVAFNLTPDIKHSQIVEDLNVSTEYQQ